MPLADRPLKSNAGAAASSDAYSGYNTICDRTAQTLTCPLMLNARMDELGIDGQSLGNGTAFSAVAPSQQPALAARRSNTREWYYSGVVLPPGPNSWPLNIPAGRPVPPILRLDQHLPRSVTRLPHTAA